MTPVRPFIAVNPRPLRAQQGVALIVALLLLIVMTVLGLSIVRTVTLEEKMAAQSYDRSLSFQSTESALREAEAYVKANTPTPASGCTKATGVCGAPASGSTERWLDSTFADWKDASAVANGPNTVTPQYFIEYLGNTFPCKPNDITSFLNCKRYRITARSNAGNDRAAVMLQSIYATE